MSKAGIYQIRNIHDGMLYIGSTKNLKKRKYCHFNRLKHNAHPNKRLQQAYNADKTAFVFEVREEIDNLDTLVATEQQHLNQYDLATELYNSSHTSHIYHTGRIRFNNYKGIRSIYQINKETHEIITQWKSAREIHKMLGFDYGTIYQACNGMAKSAYGYIWRYTEEPQLNING